MITEVLLSALISLSQPQAVDSNELVSSKSFTEQKAGEKRGKRIGEKRGKRIGEKRGKRIGEKRGKRI